MAIVHLPELDDKPILAAGETSAKTKVERVAEYLRESIIAGRFERGAKLKQSELATRFNISPTPVREALKILEAEGFILGVSHRGAVVAPFDLQSAGEVVDLRGLLEGRLALAALRRMSEDQLATLGNLHTQLEQDVERGDRDAVRLNNFRFHHYLYSIAGQPQTLRFVRILWARYPFDLINRIEGRIDVTAKEHAAIVRALVTRDEVGLLQAMSEHIHSGWSQLKAHLDQDSSEPLETTRAGSS
jgi:DNA-binding GntR family transcriptional regulator